MLNPFKKIVNSKLQLIIFITLFALLLTEILIYVQMSIFWPDKDKTMSFIIGFWTSIIVGIIASSLVLYLRAFYEKELKDINESLEKKVKEEVEKNREKELKMLEKSKMISLGDMIGNIAHQWRQPLSVISASASGIKLQKELETLNDELLYKELDDINDSAQYLSQTIDTFRDFIKDDKEHKEVIFQERVDAALNIIDASLKSNHIELINNIDYSNPVKINLTVGELSQVMINIINNAKDILVEKNIENPWIKLGLKKEKDRVIITIEDNGGGIPEDIMPKIFDPYFTTKHQSQGTGLGLHMSYRIIVESLKGRLYAKNTQNGAKFFIELPLNK